MNSDVNVIAAFQCMIDTQSESDIDMCMIQVKLHHPRWKTVVEEYYLASSIETLNKLLVHTVAFIIYDTSQQATLCKCKGHIQYMQLESPL